MLFSFKIVKFNISVEKVRWIDFVERRHRCSHHIDIAGTVSDYVIQQIVAVAFLKVERIGSASQRVNGATRISLLINIYAATGAVKTYKW